MHTATNTHEYFPDFSLAATQKACEKLCALIVECIAECNAQNTSPKIRDTLQDAHTFIDKQTMIITTLCGLYDSLQESYHKSLNALDTATTAADNFAKLTESSLGVIEKSQGQIDRLIALVNQYHAIVEDRGCGMS